jgi:hypothetical protein
LVLAGAAMHVSALHHAVFDQGHTLHTTRSITHHDSFAQAGEGASRKGTGTASPPLYRLHTEHELREQSLTTYCLHTEHELKEQSLTTASHLEVCGGSQHSQHQFTALHYAYTATAVLAPVFV